MGGGRWEVGDGRLVQEIGGKCEISLKDRWEVGMAGGGTRTITIGGRLEVGPPNKGKTGG